MADLCYPSTFENGTDTRLYVDSTVYTGVTPGAPAWVKVGGELNSKISVTPKAAEGTNKDSPAGLSFPVGYDWSMTADANWDLDDPGQVLLRAMPMALALRRVAWKPKGSTYGYYGWALVGWTGDATQRTPTKLTLAVNGCGEILYS